MPKLPANYVKGPSFDNPLRSTGGQDVVPERRVALRLDEAAWAALTAACEREGATPEAIVRRALDRWLAQPNETAVAPHEPVTAQPSRRAQLLDQLLEQFARRSWVQCLSTVREIVREGRR